MSLSRYVRLWAAVSGVTVVSFLVSAFSCDEGPIMLGGGATLSPCTQLANDAMLTRFLLYTEGPGGVSSDMLRACAFDRIEVPAGNCSLIEWNFPDEGNTPNAVNNQLGGQTFFQYDVGQACTLQLFEAQLDYTLDSNDEPVTRNRYLFSGNWIREFGSGTGPFAVGIWQEVDESFNTLATGCFDFYESSGAAVVDQVCELPE